jgi:hypothetical protein
MKTKQTNVRQLKEGDKFMFPVEFEITEIGDVPERSELMFIRALCTAEGVEMMYYAEHDKTLLNTVNITIDKVITE